MQSAIGFLSTLLSVLAGFFLIISGFFMDPEYERTYWDMITLSGAVSMTASLLMFFV